MKKKKGFTLIELLAVIVILGILLSISIVAVNNIRKKQEEENEKNVLSSILTGAKNYCADNNCNDSDAIYVRVLLDNDYVDFDKNKYSVIATETVKLKTCENKLKYKYVIKYNGIDYNDCGCDSQTGTDSDFICSD